MEKAIQTTQNNMINLSLNSIEEVKSLAQLFVESGMFSDTKSIAQAVVKIMAGHELGIGPFLAMDGIDIIAGRIAISPLLLSAIMKSQNKYNYKVIKHTDEVCEIAFFEKGTLVGMSTFTIEEAKRMELGNKDNWRKQPKTMLFWRALARGIRMYAPDLYNGLKVYTTEELDPNRNIFEDISPAPTISETTETSNNTATEETTQEEILVQQEPHFLDSLQKRKLLTMAVSKGIKKEKFEEILAKKYGEKIPASAYNEIMEYLKGVENETNRGND